MGFAAVAASALAAACVPPPSLAAQSPERCARALMPPDVFPEDSLDEKLAPLTQATQRIARPPGFPLGFRADVLVLLIIDTTGSVVSATPIAADIQRARTVGPTPFELRAGFEQAAVDLLTSQPYSVPRRHGAPVTAAVCRPVGFRER